MVPQLSNQYPYNLNLPEIKNIFLVGLLHLILILGPL